MSSIDPLILGLVMKNKMSAYDVQREIENRNINRWVKISTPSIYKKMLTYQDQGYLTSEPKENKKTIYSITNKGIDFYKETVNKVAEQEINIFLDFNSVISNFDNFTKEEQYDFLLKIKTKKTEHLSILKSNQKKKMDIHEFGKQIFKQQLVLLTDLGLLVENYMREFK